MPSANGEEIYEIHLHDILRSPSFNTSQRSQQFLRYVVAESVGGRTENLKERLIGEKIFNRQVDYDTSQDSIVRVKANEVRKRLASYYEQNPDSPIRFEMSAGSYVISVVRAEPKPVPLTAPAPTSTPIETFEEVSGPAVEKALDASASRVAVPAPKESSMWLVWTALATVVVAAGLAALWTRPWASTSLFDQYWRPFVAGDRALLLCVPTPEAYRIYGSGTRALVEAFKPQPTGTEGPPITATVRDVRIVPEQTLMLGIGDVHVLTSVSMFAAARGKRPQSRLSPMTTFADINSSPTVVVGAETNQWNIELTKGTRYVVTKFKGKNVVMDSQTNQPLCEKPNSWESPATYDCGVVTRLIRSSAAQPLLLVSGLNHYGTYTLGDLLVDPALLEPALAGLPAGWEQKNLQILVRAELLRDGVSKPRVLATHVW